MEGNNDWTIKKKSSCHTDLSVPYSPTKVFYIFKTIVMYYLIFLKSKAYEE